MKRIIWNIFLLILISVIFIVTIVSADTDIPLSEKQQTADEIKNLAKTFLDIIVATAPLDINANSENIANISIGSFTMRDIQNGYEIGNPIIIGQSNGTNVWEIPVFSQGVLVGELNGTYGGKGTEGVNSFQLLDGIPDNPDNSSSNSPNGVHDVQGHETSGSSNAPVISPEIGNILANNSLKSQNPPTVTQSVSTSAHELYEDGVDAINEYQYKDALKSLQKAVEIDPGFISAWDRIGAVLFALGKYKVAMDTYDKALKIDPGNEIILKSKNNIQLSQQWFDEGKKIHANYTESLKLYAKAIEVTPDNSKAWTMKALDLNHLGRNDEMLEALEMALKINPDDYIAYNMMHNNKGQRSSSMNCGTCPAGYSGPDVSCKCIKASCGCVQYAY